MQQKTSKKNGSKADARLWKWGAAAAATGAALAGTALYNRSNAKRAERDNPPQGEFIEVDGVRLHYVEKGKGEPLVLLHGNGAMIPDWQESGLLDQLAKNFRVIAFDRPGFGYSERPRSVVWGATAQAQLIADAMKELGIKNPLVVGHSWGTLVGLALALDNPGKLAGLVLLSGYYFPSFRADVAIASQPAIPVVGDVMRYTVSPLLGAATAPAVVKRVFAPAEVPERFENFPLEMTLRPSQIRAEAAEAALMIPAAAALAPRYSELDLPVTIIAAREDKMVDFESQSRRLHETIEGSRLHAVDDAGHMVHWTATGEVARAIKGAVPAAA